MLIRLLASILLLLIAGEQALAAKRTALVITNGTYANLPPLNKVLADARTLRETLANELGFNVVYGENLDRRAMNRMINEVEGQIEKGDIIFFYYGGHGVSLDGENYMLPVDLQRPEPGEEKFVVGDSIGVGELTRRIKAKEARATFVIMDASRKNPLPVGLENGLDNIEIPDTVFILYATAHGKASLDALSDSDKNPNSVFMRSVLSHLKQPGLTQLDLAKKVQEQVSAAASSTGWEQIPAYKDRVPELITLNDGSGEVLVEEKVEGGEAPAAASAEAAPGSQTAILEEWKIVKDSGNRKALEGFKAKYGKDPVWGPLVDQALAKLEGKPLKPAVQIQKPAQTNAETTLYRDLQVELKRVGCYVGPIDGEWGLSSRRALARFARHESRTLDADEEALNVLLGADNGTCVAAAKPSRKTVTVQQNPRKKAEPRARPAQSRPTRSCWICHTYTYETERVCLPSRIGNPEQKIPPYIRCRRG